jgi:hypothetical protein
VKAHSTAVMETASTARANARRNQEVAGPTTIAVLGYALLNKKKALLAEMARASPVKGTMIASVPTAWTVAVAPATDRRGHAPPPPIAAVGSFARRILAA